MLHKIAILIALGLASLNINAGVKVTSLNLQTSGKNGFINVNLDGRSGELPDLKVIGKKIEIILSDADSFSSIQKRVNGADLSAKMINGKAFISVVLPYELKAENVDVGWRNNNIIVSFPRGKSNSDQKNTNQKLQHDAIVKAPEILQKVEPSVAKEILDESYLNKLLDEEKNRVVLQKSNGSGTEFKIDKVTIKQASILKNNTEQPVQNNKTSDGFTFAGYATKFSLFLFLVLGLFYGIVYVLKRGVFNKGKLGFLNNAQMIQVLSTTYIGPKRSLMVVKVHKQIFLVANSENGIQFLSEMTDTAGLLKEGEKIVTGTNFDSNLHQVEMSTSEINFKIKENINESTPLPEEKGIQALTAKDIVKFSDELKKKARKLKPLEFN